MDEKRERDILLDVSMMQNRVNQTENPELGITQEYNWKKRDKLWDSTKGKNEYKDKVFDGKKTYEDKISGKTLHRSENAAKKKYHMKNKDGENVSKEWAKHSAETDHINAIKDVYDVAKHNPFLSDSDFKEIINSEENYRILSKSFNTSKKDKNDWQIILDKNNGLSTEARVELAKQKVKADVVLQGKFAARTAQNVGAEFATGAKDALVSSAIPLVVESVSKLVEVAKGEKTIDEAAQDVGKVAVDVAVVGGADRVIFQTLNYTMLTSQNEVLQNISKSGELGQIIAVAAIVKDSAVKYINGEIDGKEFVSEVGEKGVTMVAGMIGGQVGKEIGVLIGGGLAGIAAGTVGAVAGSHAGAVIGQILGTMITTVACSAIISVYNVSKSLDEYKLKERQVKRLEADALKEMAAQREKFCEIVSRENHEQKKEIQEGFDMIMSNACKEAYCLDGVTEGLDKILAVFGKSVKIKTMEQYEAQLNTTLKLSF